MQPSLPTKRLHFRRLRSQCRRWAIPSLMFLAALPVYAQTGASPWENAVNALKTSFTGPIAQGLSLVAIVVGGLGVGAAKTVDAILKLPAAVTLAFTPYGSDPGKLVERARAQHHEILLQIPMEPYDYPDNDPGPQTLLTSRTGLTGTCR